MENRPSLPRLPQLGPPAPTFAPTGPTRSASQRRRLKRGPSRAQRVWKQAKQPQVASEKRHLDSAEARPTQGSRSPEIEREEREEGGGGTQGEAAVGTRPEDHCSVLQSPHPLLPERAGSPGSGSHLHGPQRRPRLAQQTGPRISCHGQLQSVLGSRVPHIRVLPQTSQVRLGQGPLQMRLIKTRSGSGWGPHPMCLVLMRREDRDTERRRQVTMGTDQSEQHLPGTPEPQEPGGGTLPGASGRSTALGHRDSGLGLRTGQGGTCGSWSSALAATGYWTSDTGPGSGVPGPQSRWAPQCLAVRMAQAATYTDRRHS